jgi:competence protein ComEA
VGATATVVVDVVGKVLRPGVFTLPVSSRIVDAIAAAGGTAPGTDLTALDLASKLIDGEEIFVGIPPPSGVAAESGGGVVGGNTGGASTGASAATVVDLNTATQAELETLPGVGAVTAQRILDWRAQHGRFTSVGQLQQVSGIGPSKYAALVGRVKV